MALLYGICHECLRHNMNIVKGRPGRAHHSIVCKMPAEANRDSYVYATGLV